MLRAIAAAMHLRLAWHQVPGRSAARASLLLCACGCAAHSDVEELGPSASQRLFTRLSCSCAWRARVRREVMYSLPWEILRSAFILARCMHVLASFHYCGYDSQAAVSAAAV